MHQRKVIISKFFLVQACKPGTSVLGECAAASAASKALATCILAKFVILMASAVGATNPLVYQLVSS